MVPSVPQGPGGNPPRGDGWQTRVGTAALGLLLIIASLPAVAVAAAPIAGAHDVAAVFPPWWPAARTLTAAASAGQVRASGGLPGVLIVHSDQSNLAARLTDAGAFLLLDPAGMAGCQPAGPSSPLLHGTRS
jgi:hypothetical protein